MLFTFMRLLCSIHWKGSTVKILREMRWTSFMQLCSYGIFYFKLKLSQGHATITYKTKVNLCRVWYISKVMLRCKQHTYLILLGSNSQIIIIRTQEKIMCFPPPFYYFPFFSFIHWAPKYLALGGNKVMNTLIQFKETTTTKSPVEWFIADGKMVIV